MQQFAILRSATRRHYRSLLQIANFSPSSKPPTEMQPSRESTPRVRTTILPAAALNTKPVIVLDDTSSLRSHSQALANKID